MELDTTNLTLIQEWNEAKDQLKFWSQKESELRDNLIKAFFDSSKTEGTETIVLAAKWKLKATKRLTYTLNNKDGELVNILATLPSVISQNLIRWNPDLNLSIYRKLDEPTQKLFVPVLTIKPAKPSLELVAPHADADTVHESNQA